jgi:hypothetical protein
VSLKLDLLCRTANVHSKSARPVFRCRSAVAQGVEGHVSVITGQKVADKFNIFNVHAGTTKSKEGARIGRTGIWRGTQRTF